MKKTSRLLTAALAAGLTAGVLLFSGHSTAKPASGAISSRAAALKSLQAQLASWSAPNKVAGRVHTGYAANVTSGGSYNWSGYVDTSTTSGEFSGVSASWVVPKATCSAENRIMSDWVGLDGWGNQTVEQDGTLSQCYEGSVYYYSWYEMYPAGTVVFGTGVKPGDHIAASVKRSGTSYTLKVTDSTTAGNDGSATATCAAATCVDESAEWVIERPAYANTGVVPLAQFAKTTFTAAKVTGGGTTGVVTTFAPTEQITMVDSLGNYGLDTTSALNAAGNSFSETWKNSY